MNANAFRRLIYTELLLALREPAAMFMSIILPLAIFLALGFSVGDIEIPVDRKAAEWTCSTSGTCCSPATSPG